MQQDGTQVTGCCYHRCPWRLPSTGTLRGAFGTSLGGDDSPGGGAGQNQWASCEGSVVVTTGPWPHQPASPHPGTALWSVLHPTPLSWLCCLSPAGRWTHGAAQLCVPGCIPKGLLLVVTYVIFGSEVGVF